MHLTVYFKPYACCVISTIISSNAVVAMARMGKYPNFEFEVVNAFKVMITQGRLPYGHLHQFHGRKGEFTIQRLTSWPHSKWRHSCYHNN